MTVYLPNYILCGICGDEFKFANTNDMKAMLERHLHEKHRIFHDHKAKQEGVSVLTVIWKENEYDETLSRLLEWRIKRGHVSPGEETPNG